MADTNIRFTINLKASQQGRYGNSRPTGQVEEVNKSLFNAITYAISDIAFKASKNQQRNIQNQLEVRMSGIVMGELSKMGRKIASLAIGIGPGQRHPTGGSLEIEGPISTAFSRANPQNVGRMSLQAVTGQWRARTQEYLQRKAKKFGHRKWWLNSGELRASLINPQLYIGAYGPIRVSWEPERVETSFKTGSASRYSNLARGVGRSYTVSVGKVYMTVLGRITRQMLNEPGERSYDSRFNGLLESLPDDVEKKLANRGDPYRPVLEPFLTFYLNRQIPNRIWYELEKSMKPLGVRR